MNVYGTYTELSTDSVFKIVSHAFADMKNIHVSKCYIGEEEFFIVCDEYDNLLSDSGETIGSVKFTSNGKLLVWDNNDVLQETVPHVIKTITIRENGACD